MVPKLVVDMGVVPIILTLEFIVEIPRLSMAVM